MCQTTTMWAKAISKRNPKQMIEFYSKNAILLATYDTLITSYKGIFDYFISFLDKDNLTCEITEIFEQVDPESSINVCSGTYTFRFTEKCKQKEVLARFSIVTENGLIINHHSSLEPE
jgi:hypothetical protein